MKIHSKGYAPTNNCQKQTWVVHRRCARKFKAEFPNTVLISMFHGSTKDPSHPLYKSKCRTCGKPL